mgnify:CR=1 FL=1
MNAVGAPRRVFQTQAPRALTEAELQPVVAAARAWLEVRAAGDDRAAAQQGLEAALMAARKSAGGGGSA